MCVEVIAAVGIISSLAGAGISAYGQMQAGQAAKDQAQYSNQVAQNNAIIASRMAADAEKRGAVAEDEQRRKTAALAGRQRAVMAANNLDVGSGSPLDILADTAQFGELDALTVRNNARREALGYETQSVNYQNEGRMSLMRGDSAERAGYIGAAGTLASGVGSVAANWYKMK